MPNWIRNKLTIESQNSKTIISELVNGEEQLDFEKVVPMPETLKITSGSITDECISLYMFSIRGTKKYNQLEKLLNKYKKNVKTYTEQEFDETVNKYVGDNVFFNDKKLETRDDVLNFGKQVINNLQKYGFPDWYSWSIYNWGTKWNASETAISENEIRFETAWDPPFKYVQELSNKYPECNFVLEYAEEQIGFRTGRVTFKNGEAIEYKGYEDFTKEAYEHSFEMWPEMKRYFKFDRKKNTYVEKQENME